MNKEVERELKIEPHSLKSVSVGFNENEFLLVLDYSEQDAGSGYAVTMPAEAMKQIVDGFTKCGKDYQSKFNKDIGF